MKTTITMLLAGTLLTSGCATTGDGALAGKNAAGPAITKIKIAITNLGPELKREVTAKEPDFVLLKVDVRNPEAVNAHGIIACHQDHLARQRPLQHRFDLAPQKQSQYMVPLDDLQERGYTMRCRLEFQDARGNQQRAPSPWVKVKVPSRS